MPRRSNRCTVAKATFVKAEIQAHIELSERGRTRSYKVAEHRSEVAFARGRKLGCRWASKYRR